MPEATEITPERQQALMARAWEHLESFLYQGQTTLDTGKVRELKPGEIMQLAVTLAKMAPPRRRQIGTVEDFLLKVKDVRG